MSVYANDLEKTKFTVFFVSSFFYDNGYINKLGPKSGVVFQQSRVKCLEEEEIKAVY